MEQNTSNDKPNPKALPMQSNSLDFNEILKDGNGKGQVISWPSSKGSDSPKSQENDQGNIDDKISSVEPKEISLKEYYELYVNHLQKGLDGKNAKANAITIFLYVLLSHLLANLEMMPHLYLLVDHRFPHYFFIKCFKKIFPNLLVVRKGDLVKSLLYKFAGAPGSPILFLDNLGLDSSFKDIFINRPSEKEEATLIWDTKLDLFSQRIIMTKTPPSNKIKQISIVLHLDSLKGLFFMIKGMSNCDNIKLNNRYSLNTKLLKEERNLDLSFIEPTFWLRQILSDLLDKDIITVTDYEMTLHLLDQNSESLKRNYEYDEDQELLMWINNYLVANEIPDERSTGKKMSDEVSLESITSYIKWESDDTVKLSVRKLHFLLAEYDIAVKFFRKDVLSKGGNPDALIKSSRRQLTYVIIDVEKLRSILNKE
jgi:hypothetical protein